MGKPPDSSVHAEVLILWLEAAVGAKDTPCRKSVELALIVSATRSVRPFPDEWWVCGTMGCMAIMVS